MHFSSQDRLRLHGNKRPTFAMQYEDILQHIGHFGKYQKRFVVLLSLIQLPTIFHFLAQVFLAANADHWCLVPASQAVNCSLLQLDSSACQEAQKNQSIPYELDSQGSRVYSSCERYVLDDEGEGDQGTNSTDVVACDAGWDFDRSRYISTINDEFSLVCDREDLAGLAQSVWFAGLLTGSLVWGSVGDWLGRRKTSFLSLALVAVSSIVTTFAPNFAAFAALRFITAACAFGAFLMTYIISSEIVGPSKRVLVGTVAAIFASIGYVILSMLAYFIRDWRHLQLAISLPYVVAFLLVLVVPESPRWLISKGRFKEAEKIITKIAKVNGTKVPENLFESLENIQENETDPKSSSARRTTVLDLFRTPNIRKKTLVIFFNWFVTNMTYYGLSLSTSSLGIDDYVAAFVSGALEVPAALFNWFVMEKFGRRFSLSALFVSGGVFCLITTFVPLGAGRVAVAMIGKFAITAVFNHIYIYSSELYPTVIRGIGLGASSMVARVSGVLCPIILILGKYWQPLPLCVFGGSSVLAGMLSLMLPETLGRDMPDTIQDGEQAGMGPGLSVCRRKDLKDGLDSKPPENHLPLSTNNKSATEPVAI
ncbi:organic cation transporter protein-like [Patiria miniata]|uniref:Major facilitator superfamily (MFS) profile domain-containing protein n=1 Tax=Patiria miniata TaxID=46514 RepID=A0A913Z9F1_PATMI|nr:organic cation transporter protein-like [Patiria miniata]